MSATDHFHRKEPLPCSDEPKSIRLEDVLITEELSRRSPRQPNLQAENQAMRSLARQLAHEPARMLQSLVDLAIELCDAGTAGVSLVETQPNREAVFRWVAMAGTLATYGGGCVPRNSCPCGVCLDRGIPLLFSHPERYFPYFQQVGTPLVESLVLPLIAEGQALGTIWITAHDAQRQFDAEDARLMMGLADFTAAALLRSQQQANQLRAASTALAVEVGKRELAEDQVLAVIENLPGGAAFVVDRDLRYQLAAGEALAIAGLKPSDLVGQTIFEGLPPELAAYYEPMYRQALAGEPFEHEHQAHARWYVSRGTPLRAESGDIYAVLVVSYDISERKCAEASIEADLKDTRLLHDLAVQGASTGQGQELYQNILDTAIALMHADMGSLQILDPAHNELHLQAWRGFHPDAATFWRSVRVDGSSSCSVALRQGERVILSDIEACDFIFDTADLNFFHLCGIRAVQSTPLLSHSGQLIGMFSTHWGRPHHPGERELRFLDILARQAADLIEHQQAKAALQASEAKYRSLFNSIDEGFLMAEVIYDESGRPVDALYLEGNPAASRLTGVPHYTQQCLSDVSPNFEFYWVETYDRVLKTGISERAEQFAAPLGRWYDFYVFPISDTANLGDDRRVAILFQDITDRKRTEAILKANAQRQSFLLEFSDALRPLVDAEAIRYQAACILGKHLGANRVGYGEAEDDETIVISRHHTDGIPGLQGRYRYDDYGPEILRELKAGRTIVRGDIAHDPSLTDAEKAAHAVLQLGAMVNVPLLKAGRLLAVLFVHFRTAHAWSDSELALIAEVAERIWDAVERARAEAALRESEENYRQLFTSIDEGFCIIEVLFDDAGQPFDHRILQANPGFERHSGIPNPVGKTAKELVPGVEPFWNDLYAQVIATGQSVRREVHSEAFNRWFEVLVSRIGNASFRQVAVVFTDITHRKQAESTIAADLRDTQLLQELSVRLTSEENIQVLYNEIIAAAIALTQADAGTVQIFDEATQDLVLLATQGFDPDVINHFQRVDANSQTSCGLALSRGQRVFIDFDDPEQADPDGSLQIHVTAGYFSAQSTPLITRLGHPIGMVSTHWHDHYRPTERELRFLDLLARQAADLIEQRRAEFERRQLLEREQSAREEAERANRIKDEFLAILSHELRSPLNPILGWSKLLQSKPFDPATIQQGLSTIERNAKLQTQLIDDLLDISRILRGKLNLKETTVNLATAIEAAMEVVKTAAQAKSIILQFTLAKACQIRGDAGRLQQVIWNLLSNAIKFTPNGGHVTVRLEQTEERERTRETVEDCQSDGGQGSGARDQGPGTRNPNPKTHPTRYAQITVTDTGQGIGPAFMPYLFQSFRQEDASITRQYGGLGLGLAIVKYLVDAHGGSITATSPGVGQGATFTVQLPLLQGASAPPLPPISADIDLTGLKVLAVDDSEDTRELLATVLTVYGAETKVVASGPEVLAHLAAFSPDLLICDIGMPDMDGYTLLQQVRALPGGEGGNIPAIAVTAFAREEDRQKALAYGFQQHLAKPIEPKDLASAIAQLVVR